MVAVFASRSTTALFTPGSFFRDPSTASLQWLQLMPSTLRVTVAISIILPFVLSDFDALQSQGIADHRHGAEGHGGGGQPGRQITGRGDGDADGVVEEGPEEVLLDVAHRQAAQADRRGDGPQVSAHQ